MATDLNPAYTDHLSAAEQAGLPKWVGTLLDRLERQDRGERVSPPHRKQRLLAPRKRMPGQLVGRNNRLRREAEARRLAILVLTAQGWSCEDIARQLGILRTSVSRLRGPVIVRWRNEGRLADQLERYAKRGDPEDDRRKRDHHGRLVHNAVNRRSL